MYSNSGFSGTRLSPGISLAMVILSFTYSTLISVMPMLKMWGRFTLGKNFLEKMENEMVHSNGC